MKSTIFSLARRTGVFAFARGSRWRNRRLLILCYHGVSMLDEHEWNPELYVTADHLRRRIEWLRRHRYAILPLGEALERLEAGTLPPRAVSLTFDDGAGDFAERAVPVLRELDAPATVYLTTYYCDTRYPVFDTALSYLLWKAVGAQPISVDIAGTAVEIDTRSRELAAASAQRVREHVARVGTSAEGKQQVLGNVAGALGLDFQAFLDSGMLRIMSPAQVAELPRPLIDVQLHTHRHRTPRDEELFVREIAQNRDRIASMIASDGASIRHFCYPSGDYARAFRPWLRDAGVSSATTCVPGIASPDDDPMLLPRLIDTMAMPELTFEAWATGFAALLPRQRIYRLDRDRE